MRTAAHNGSAPGGRLGARWTRGALREARLLRMPRGSGAVWHCASATRAPAIAISRSHAASAPRPETHPQGWARGGRIPTSARLSERWRARRRPTVRTRLHFAWYRSFRRVPTSASSPGPCIPERAAEAVTEGLRSRGSLGALPPGRRALWRGGGPAGTRRGTARRRAPGRCGCPSSGRGRRSATAGPWCGAPRRAVRDCVHTLHA